MHPSNQKIVQTLQSYQQAQKRVLSGFYANMKKIRVGGMKQLEAIMKGGEKVQLKKMEEELKNQQ